jgi:hypothetical protein
VCESGHFTDGLLCFTCPQQTPEGVVKELVACINQALEGAGKPLSDVACIGYG